ncbi:MAG: ABC transporter permease [Acidobacteria bacterium]|jgi:putative ABC transport system permease protein|nr:MAG: ABC transporter permease [Acidobacteriota bacterium]
MNFVALQMLLGDRAKYLGLIFAVAFSTFLMSHQSSIFAGIMRRTTSQIMDVPDANLWVMDRKTQYFDEVKALTDDDLYRVRGVPGIEWAVPLFKGLPRAKAFDGNFRVVIMMGVDDATLVGAPRNMVLGSADDLRRPDAVIIDRVGYEFFFPGQPYELGKPLELNDHRVNIVGIYNSSAPFQNLPVFYSRYSQAVTYVGRERNQLSFVLAKAAPGVSDREASRRIEAVTGLRAATSSEFGWQTIWYYIDHTGIPINFGITIGIALVVGTIVAGQTFYIFTLENLKQFGALKAIGVTNWRITGMILLQALMVGVIGFSIGIGMTAAFFELTKNVLDLRGFSLLWQIAAGTGGTVLLIVILASLMSIRRVLVLEPAIVFRG